MEASVSVKIPHPQFSPGTPKITDGNTPYTVMVNPFGIAEVLDQQQNHVGRLPKKDIRVPIPISLISTYTPRPSKSVKFQPPGLFLVIEEQKRVDQHDQQPMTAFSNVLELRRTTLAAVLCH